MTAFYQAEKLVVMVWVYTYFEFMILGGGIGCAEILSYYRKPGGGAPITRRQATLCPARYLQPPKNLRFESSRV